MEELLLGGNTTPGVVRIGETVRRPRGHRAAFAAEVLRVLNAAGAGWAPRYLGIDDAGRDTFSFIHGTTTEHPAQRDERCYALVGRMLRELHDMTAETEAAHGRACVVHGDPGPFNAIMRGGLPVALIDWDSARPGDPMEDVGYAAWTWCTQAIGDVPVDDQARRVRELATGYDPALTADAVIAAIEGAQHMIIEAEGSNVVNAALAEERRRHARAAVAWARADHLVLEQNRGAFVTAFSA